MQHASMRVEYTLCESSSSGDTQLTTVLQKWYEQQHLPWQDAQITSLYPTNDVSIASPHEPQHQSSG